MSTPTEFTPLNTEQQQQLLQQLQQARLANQQLQTENQRLAQTQSASALHNPRRALGQALNEESNTTEAIVVEADKIALALQDFRKSLKVFRKH
ncbi:hypothetical protein RvY_01800 [Ramazzottius varieornatus]|uniref:Uncharacterized protein n=1 Tax=Ramazzottius varieornatus TaxID=947166 RepID=A0A1D1USB3_RAMVA|nr:hypothetical protein RvY_01800 [Ramazzottius varieornatus]